MPPTGKVIAKGKFLHIHCVPQIAQKLVKLFSGAKRGEDSNAVIISATDTNCRDLQWIRQRYPLELVDGARDIVEKGEARHLAREAAVEATRAEGYIPPTFKLAVPAREYQSEAADLLHRSGGLLLADDLGLGKTVSAIAAMCGGDTLPAIVVTLTHLTKQWTRELNRFAPELKVHVINRGEPYTLADVRLTELGPSGKRRIVKNGIRRMPDVIILNYHKLAKWRDALIDIGPKMIVFDECQELRTGEESGKGEAAHGVARVCNLRMGLSATPIYNYGSEIWNVMEGIAPGLLGSYNEFDAEWCTFGGKKAKVREPHVLRAHLIENGAMLRRRRRDVGRELPELTRIWHTVDTDIEALEDVSKSVAELAEAVLAADLTPFARMTAARDLDWRLRQATGLAKVPGILSLVSMLLETDDQRRVLLYAHHHMVFDAFAEGFTNLGYEHVRFTGEETPNQKEAALNAFITGNARIMMMAIRSGAGIDGIQNCCDTVVKAELDWSPGVHIQAEGRAHRDGQKNPVMVYYAVSDDGSDPVIQDALGLKESQRLGIVEGTTDGASVLEGAEGDRMKKLAEAYLAKVRGGDRRATG